MLPAIIDADPGDETMKDRCTVCRRPWEEHYDPALLPYKNGPYGIFGLVMDHTPHIEGIHA